LQKKSELRKTKKEEAAGNNDEGGGKTNWFRQERSGKKGEKRPITLFRSVRMREGGGWSEAAKAILPEAGRDQTR